jgi:acetyltransferase
MKSNSCSETIHAIRDGFSYCIRPIAKNDKKGLIELFNQLSQENRYLRFAHAILKLPDAFLEDILELDYKKEMAFVAVITHSNIEKIIGIARYVAIDSENVCEFSISVGDEYAAHGVGMNLMKYLINHAQQQNLKKMIGYILTGNIKMLKMVRELGFHINTASPETGFKIAELDLNN